MRIFGSEKISGIMGKLGMENGQPIEHPMVSKAVANAQKKVEAHNFDIRKHLLEYDDVMNKQREVFYDLRREVLDSDNHKAMLMEMAEELVSSTLDEIAHEKIFPEEWDIESLNEFMERQFLVSVSKKEDGSLAIGDSSNLSLEDCDREKLHETIMNSLQTVYSVKEEGLDPEMMSHLQKMIMLQVIDNLWKDHLLGMDHLKDGVGLRGYAQKNPLTEYKKEGFEMFSLMMQRISEGVTEYLFKVQVEEGSESIMADQSEKKQVVEHRGSNSEEPAVTTVRRDDKKVGRNDPCHCGSGKKFKKCHGK
jgi:preprotein translocase subunit SecA